MGSLQPTTPRGVGVTIVPAFQPEIWLREVSSVAQGHTAYKRQGLVWIWFDTGLDTKVDQALSCLLGLRPALGFGVCEGQGGHLDLSLTTCGFGAFPSLAAAQPTP